VRGGRERVGHRGRDEWCEQHRGDKYGSDCDCTCNYNCECGGWEWDDHEYGVDDAEWDEWRCCSGAGYCWVNDCRIGWFDDYALIGLSRSMDSKVV
jgi:hypothetical protein